MVNIQYHYKGVIWIFMILKILKINKNMFLKAKNNNEL